MLTKFSKGIVLSNLAGSLVVTATGLLSIFSDPENAGVINLTTVLFHWNIATTNAGLLLTVIGIFWSLGTMVILIRAEQHGQNSGTSSHPSVLNKVGAGVKLSWLLWGFIGVAAYVTNYALFSIAFLMGLVLLPIGSLIYLTMITSDS
jgi:hypothetical protein